MMKFRTLSSKTTKKPELAPPDSKEYVYWFEHLTSEDDQLQKVKTFQQKVLTLKDRDPILVSENFGLLKPSLFFLRKPPLASKQSRLALTFSAGSTN